MGAPEERELVRVNVPVGLQYPPTLPKERAWNRLSDSGEDAKEKVTQKVGGAGKSFLPFYFRVSAFGPDSARGLEQATDRQANGLEVM